AEPVYRGKADLGQVHTLFGQRQQVLALDQQADANRLFPPGDHPAFIFSTCVQQLPVQIGDIHRLWHRHPVIPPEIASLSFNPTLLMGLGWVAKVRLEAPVGSQRYEACCLFSTRATENLFHRRRQIVVLLWRAALCGRGALAPRRSRWKEWMMEHNPH